MDFNQLLRDSRRLESAMEGVSSSMRARPDAAPAMGSAAGSGVGGAAQNGAAGVGIQSMRVPPLTRSLAQLDVAAAKLMRMAGTGAPMTAAADSQAQLLLAAKGIDVRKQARALKELQQAQPARGGGAGATAGPLPIEQFHPLDIERFLQQQQQMLCHSAMEETARVTSDTYRRHALSSLDEDWEVAKRDLLDGLGFRAGKNAIAQAAGGASFQQQEEAKRKAGAMGVGANAFQQQQQQQAAAGPVLGMEQAIYARTIQELNRARVRRTPVPLIAMLKLAASNVDEFFQRQQGAEQVGHQTMSANGLAVGDVTDCWDVLRCMLQQPSSDNAADEYAQQLQPRAELLVEQAYAAAYNAAPDSAEGSRFRAQLIDGAKSYSESLFAAYLRRVVAAHPEARRGQQQQAQGGRPSFARQVASYVAVLGDKLPSACRDFQLEGLPFWPQVYYCFRCGHIGDAVQLLHQALEQHGGAGGLGRMGGGALGSGAGAYENLTRVFVECMEQRVALKERSLSNSLWISLHEEYQRELAMGVNSARAHGASASQAGMYLDPFKLALYHLLGRFCLPQAHFLDLSALVAPTTEDYLWMKLSVLHEGVAGAGPEVPDALRDHVDVNSLRLASLQADLLARGEAAFNPDGRHPLSYFKVLLLSQQFEQAVYYIIKTAHFTVGVHFAVALQYAGCMHTHANSKQELLIALSGAGAAGSNQGAAFALNYSRVLRKYVESFVCSHPFEAFHYLYLLHSQAGAAGGAGKATVARARGLGNSNASFGLLTPSVSDASQMDEADASSSSFSASDPSFAALRDLLLETREYDLLVGSIVSSGGGSAQASGGAADSIQTSRGLLYNYFSRSEAQQLLVATGSAMESHGLTLDAIQLYLLAYRFDLAIELALKALAPLLPSPVQQGERQAVVELAQRVQRVVRNQQEAGQTDGSQRGGSNFGDASPSSLLALHQMLRLVNYFDLYHQGPHKYEDALVVLKSDVPLLAFDAASVNDAVSRFSHESSTHRQLQRCIAPVAVSVMDIYYVQFQMMKRELQQSASLYQPSHVARDHNQQQRISALRNQAAALMSFLGLIQNTMQIDSDVYAKLVATEALMAA